MAAVWICRSNELFNHIESDSLGPVLLRIPLFWACFTQILAVINSFMCAGHFSSKYRAIFSYGTMKYCNGGHEQESKTRTKPVYPSVWGQPRGKSETIVSWSESPIYRSKATRNGFDGWMELVFTKFYLWVFLFPFDVTFLNVQFLLNARTRSVFLHRFLKYFAGNISENVWQLSRHVNKAFIYSRILKFRERISRGKF